LVDPNFYHLDTCFCPVGTTSALWFPPAFSAKTQKEVSATILGGGYFLQAFSFPFQKIQRRLPAAIAVSPKEATAFVCNAINIRRKVITPPGMAAKTKEALASLDYTVDEVKMDEFMKVFWGI
jgi:N-dimethylarginine dimethylaminohydrolase